MGTHEHSDCAPDKHVCKAKGFWEGTLVCLHTKASPDISIVHTDVLLGHRSSTAEPLHQENTLMGRWKPCIRRHIDALTTQPIQATWIPACLPSPFR